MFPSMFLHWYRERKIEKETEYVHPLHLHFKQHGMPKKCPIMCPKKRERIGWYCGDVLCKNKMYYSVQYIKVNNKRYLIYSEN